MFGAGGPSSRPQFAREPVKNYHPPPMPVDVNRILDQIADLLAQDKDLLSENVSWAKRTRAGFDQLEFTAPIAVGGVIRDGLQARITCRSDLPDEDVHAQLQVYVPVLAGYAHVQRVDWRPTAPHTNNAQAPSKLRFKTLKTRRYDFGVNRRLGIAGLRQTTTMIAQECPNIENFKDFLVFLEEMWKVRGISRVPMPPWEGRLV